MKHFILSFVVLLGLTCSACSQNKKKETKIDNKKTTLVAYFSATGTTAEAAKHLAKAADADIYEIVPEKKYTAADLDWHDKQSLSSIEMKDKTSRPAITGKISNLAQYKVIYLGFPIWWYTAPTIINTFIEKNNIQDKTIIVFATSGGSTTDKATKDLQSAYPKNKWKDAGLLNNATLKKAQELVKNVK